MSDTPETDAFREVVFAQYKEDELTGDGMGNILAALTNIETLERKRECECKCDVDWPEEYYELRQRLERERDDALRKLESLEESITSLDHPNIRILLRQAESYALDVAEKHEKRYCEIKKQLADSNVHLENITIERDSERALADRLVKVVEHSAKIIGPPDSEHDSRWVTDDELDDLWNRTQSALAAWKEARND